MRSNRRVNIQRPQSGVAGLSASETYDVIHSDIRAWVRFSSAMVLTIDGSEVAADGNMRVGAAHQVRRGDVVRVVDDTRAFRIEAVDEMLSTSGRVVGYTAFLSRDESLE